MLPIVQKHNLLSFNLGYHDEHPLHMTFSIESNKVERWWPNGYGQQKLYNMHVGFESDYPKQHVSLQRKVAFR